MSSEVAERSLTTVSIIEVAAAAFAERGYAAVSMRDIALGCGCTPAAIYYHFDGKLALYRAVLRETFQTRVKPASAIVNAGGNPLKRLEALITWYGTLVTSDPVFARLLHRELLDGDEETHRFLGEEVFGDSYRELIDFISPLVPADDTHRTLSAMFGLVFGYYEFWPVRRFLDAGDAGDDPADLAAFVVRALSGTVFDGTTRDA